jgi:hypothetical protein
LTEFALPSPQLHDLPRSVFTHLKTVVRWTVFPKLLNLYAG